MKLGRCQPGSLDRACARPSCGYGGGPAAPGLALRWNFARVAVADIEAVDKLGGCSARNTADLRAFQAQIVHQASRIENEANDGACEAFGVDGAASAERYDCD